MRIAWITDPHVNFIADREWFRAILDEKPDGVLITGDIAESKSIRGALLAFAEETTRPIYFVLGNHDFYRSSFASVRADVTSAVADVPSLVYLHDRGIVRLSDKTALVGVDGWYDGRNGDFDRSSVVLNDFLVIDDLRKHARIGDVGGLRRRMEQYTDADAERLVGFIEKAIDPRLERLIIATHVPPFAGAARHEGKVSGPDHLPFFSNKAIGLAVMEATKTFRERLGGHVEIYCGHTHSEGVIHPAENLSVYTGAAEYYAPSLAGWIDCD